MNKTAMEFLTEAEQIQTELVKETKEIVYAPALTKWDKQRKLLEVSKKIEYLIRDWKSRVIAYMVKKQDKNHEDLREIARTKDLLQQSVKQAYQIMVNLA